MLEAFNTLMSVLYNVCCLHVPCGADKFTLHTDASVGGILNVIREGETLPVAFYSRQLRGA